MASGFQFLCEEQIYLKRAAAFASVDPVLFDVSVFSFERLLSAALEVRLLCSIFVGMVCLVPAPGAKSTDARI